MSVISRLVAAIKEMNEVDQGVRMQANPTPGSANYLVYVTDLAHNVRVKNLIAEFGYPTKEMVGAEALFDWWLVIQHQDADVVLQEACLRKCGFGPKEEAHLQDRVLVNRGEEQMYGTQLQRLSDGTRTTKPIKDRETVDARRASKDLEPLSEYLKSANQ